MSSRPGIPVTTRSSFILAYTLDNVIERFNPELTVITGLNKAINQGAHFRVRDQGKYDHVLKLVRFENVADDKLPQLRLNNPHIAPDIPRDTLSRVGGVRVVMEKAHQVP